MILVLAAFDSGRQLVAIAIVAADEGIRVDEICCWQLYRLLTLGRNEQIVMEVVICPQMSIAIVTVYAFVEKLETWRRTK